MLRHVAQSLSLFGQRFCSRYRSKRSFEKVAWKCREFSDASRNGSLFRGGYKPPMGIPSARIALTNLARADRKSTRLNSSHVRISYAVFCLKKKKRRRLPYHLEP